MLGADCKTSASVISKEIISVVPLLTVPFTLKSFLFSQFDAESKSGWIISCIIEMAAKVEIMLNVFWCWLCPCNYCTFRFSLKQATTFVQCIFCSSFHWFVLPCTTFRSCHKLLIFFKATSSTFVSNECFMWQFVIANFFNSIWLTISYLATAFCLMACAPYWLDWCASTIF